MNIGNGTQAGTPARAARALTALATAGITLGLLAGCASMTEEVDVAAERRAKLNEDLERWEAVQTPVAATPLTLRGRSRGRFRTRDRPR